MRSKTAATGMMRRLLLGLGIGIVVLLGVFFVTFFQPDQSEDAQRIQAAQERIQEVTPSPPPESAQQ